MCCPVVFFQDVLDQCVCRVSPNMFQSPAFHMCVGCLEKDNYWSRYISGVHGNDGIGSFAYPFATVAEALPVDERRRCVWLPVFAKGRHH